MELYGLGGGKEDCGVLKSYIYKKQKNGHRENFKRDYFSFTFFN